jgi:threonine-phosphate decarboxylase
MTHAVHGGDILSAAERYGGSASEYLDFSSNINPLGPPQAVLQVVRERAADTNALSRYPDQYYRALREALARHAAVPCESIVVAGGGAALFDAVVRALRPASCLLPVPAFSEYQRVLNATQTPAIRFPLQAQTNFALDIRELQAALLEHRPRLCVLTNPHNPSGNLTDRDDLLALIAFACDIDTIILIDEAFIDYVPEQSLTPAAPRCDNLIISRSLTKFYSMPAMRVGYGVASPALAATIAAQIPSWPITAVAADAAVAALGDDAYDQRTREINERERSRFAQALTALGLRVFPAHANFLLVETEADASVISTRLAERRRILVRDCSSYDGLEDGRYLRVAVRLPAENNRLIEALRTSAAALG